jgi:hypothetical protein
MHVRCGVRFDLLRVRRRSGRLSPATSRQREDKKHMPITAPHWRLELSSNATDLRRGQSVLDFPCQRHGFAQTA